MQPGGREVKRSSFFLATCVDHERGRWHAAVAARGDGAMKACYVYLVVASDNSLYTGISSDPAHRTSEHNAGRRGAKALRGKRPVRLLRRWLCESRSAALRLEAEIKKLRPPEKWSAVLSNDSDDGLDSGGEHRYLGTADGALERSGGA